MLRFAEKLDLKQAGLDHTPLVRSWNVEVERPTLRDNTGLADRLARVLQKEAGASGFDFPLNLASGLNNLYLESGFRVWTACRVEGGRGRLVAVESSPGPGAAYGLAVDIGSTTLVLALVDLDRPEVVDQTTLPNPQIEYGADILTRVHFSEQPGGMEKLTGCLRQAVNRGAADLCSRNGLRTGQIVASVMAGNTTMTHFLLGLPLRTVIREPYVPVMNRPPELKASEIALDIAPEAPVLVMPNKGSYFGGDLMAGILITGMASHDKPCLMVDVGTNAEVVLGQKDWLIGAAGAAGPALEGGVARMGMVAAPGAVEQVRIDRETRQLSYRTIGGQPPRGLCGSGLIDLFAELFLSGIIDFQGKLTLPPGHPQRMETDEGPAFVVVPEAEAANGEPILLSEIEIDILTRSKAGMYTILSTVIKSVGLQFSDLDRFFVAGTFGQFIDPRMAVAVGMIPDIPLERFVPLGNSSLKGAILALVSEDARREVLEIWRKLTYLEMNVNQELMNRFSAARFLPHTDRSRFPSVGTLIK